MELDDEIAAIWPLAGFDKTLHYRVPAGMVTHMIVGSLVRVPVGRRFTLGVVVEMRATADVDYSKLKLVSQVCYEQAIMTKPLLKLAEWIRAYYGAKREAVLETMIPGPIRQGMSAKRDKYVSAGEKPSQEDLDALERRAPKQKVMYDFICQQFKPQKKSLILDRLNLSAATYNGLLQKGFIVEESRIAERIAYQDDIGKAEFADETEIVLNEEQKVVVESLRATMDKGGFATRLLHGVTGSGKTEVYLNAMQAALDRGQGILFLVPEVALTPQTLGRIRSRLSKYADVQTVVWHSHLSDGERLDAWMALASGAAKVVVGARSAVFAPIENLGLIVVDEEHEPAYKQDETPRYHGRDVAVYRAYLEGVLCVLGTATPSLETYRNVKRGKYGIDRLTQRVDDRALPMMHVVDMRQEIARRRKATQLSTLLVEKLRNRFEQKEQTILFINRRGFSSSMMCQDCGHVVICDHCSVPMTYHRSDETLKCHLCGDEANAPKQCPECKSPKIRWKGMGTQRIEDAVTKVLPNAKVVRIDADTMGRKHLFREILGDFRSGKIDVLVGTQMIAKGLDFPNVTLVGMVDADLSLHIPDFRANERTFQLLVQVSGRAGRGDLAGEVVVQTFTPHADPIQFARRGEVDAFLDVEAESRERFQYPPYRHLIRQVFRGPNPEKVLFFAEQFAKRVEAQMGARVELRGPAPCSIEKMKDNYRFQVWYFTSNIGPSMAELVGIATTINWPKDVIQVMDADPVSLS
ncbi:MAG: primosomal protein N' [Opitutaceae bacterium]|nr:primosomal protein N' [Opitutaceae bacterium]